MADEFISVALPNDLRAILDDLARSESVTVDELIVKAIREHLCLRRFRRLRERLVVKAAGLGFATDQDIFDRVS